MMAVMRNHRPVVNREKMITTLKANRTAHQQMVAESREGYKTQVAGYSADLAQRIKVAQARAADGAIIDWNKVFLKTPEPVTDYTSVYDEVIAMFEDDVRENIELSVEAHRCFMQNRWDWMAKFLMSNKGRSAATLAYSRSF